MNFDSSDLRDPQPPLPGEQERAKVAARAHELGRRRRLVQGGGALAMVAAVAVSVAALTGGGGSGGPSQVAVAGSGAETSSSTAVSHVTTVPTTVAPAPETTVAPAPAPDTTPAAVEQAPSVAPQTAAPVQPAATTFTLSGTVTGNPADTSVQLQITGAGGTVTVNADAAGNYTVSGLEAGDYTVIGTWVDSTNTASRAEKFGTVTISGNSTASFTFSE